MEKFSVKKPYTVLVGVIMVLVLGFVSVTSMAMDLLPSISIPTLIVITTYPGASAEKVESDVTMIMESGLGTISGVTDVTSTSSENYSMIQLSFEDSTDMDTALVKVSSEVQNLTAYLPDGCGTPSIMEISMDMAATMYLSVSYDGYDVYELSDFVSGTITPSIERVSGVASVSEIGIVEKTIYVELNQEKIDEVNASILAEVDSGLKEAKEALDEADEEVQQAIEELNDAQSTFATSITDEIYAQLEDPLSQGVTSVQDGLVDVSDMMNSLKLSSDALDFLDIEVDLGSGETEEIDPLITAFAGMSTEEQEALLTMVVALNSDDIEYTDETYGVTVTMTAVEALLYSQLLDGSAAYENGLTSAQASAVSTMLTAMGQSLSAEMVGTFAAADLSTSLTAIQYSFIAATGVTDMIEAAQVAIETVTEALDDLDLEFGSTEDGTWTLVDMDDLEDMLDEYNQQVINVQNQVWILRETAASLPDMVSSLLGVYAGMTQIQLEAAVGFSTAQISLSLAESELESARLQYEAAEESALANANLDALLDVSVLAQLIYAQNFSMPAGYIDDENDNTWLLKVGQEYETTEELADALLLTMDGIGDVTVSDVADVIVIDNADDVYAMLDGENSVILAIFKSSTAGTNEVGNSVIEMYDELMETYDGLNVSVLMNQGDYIDIIVDSVVSSMAVGALLAIIILAVFLKDFLPTLVVGVSIPLSVLFALVLMYFTDLSLNMMTLCGLALGIGMLVDNSIVVIENIYRLRLRGISSARAAVQGTKQVAGAIIASTLTTICVFLPLVFTTGTVNELLMPLGLCIAYCLFASLAIALTVVPAAASTLLRHTKNKLHPWFDAVQEFYGKTLDLCLRRKLIPLTVTVVLLGFCVWQVFQMGIVVIPSISADQVQVTLETDPELTRAESYAAADEVMMALLEVENVASVGAMSSSAATSLFGFSSGDDYGSYLYYITMADDATATQISDACTEMTEAIASLGYEGEASSDSMSDMSALTASGLSITITGNDLDTLVTLGEEVALLVAQVEGYTNIYNGVGEGEATILVDIDKDKAMEYGFTVAQIYMEIASYLTNEATSTSLTVDGESMTVVVQDLSSPLTVENLMDIEFTVTSTTTDSSMDMSAFSSDAEDETEAEEEEEDAEEDTGVYLLSDFATMVETTSVASINRENQSRYISVTASTLDGYNATLLAREMEEIITQAKADGLFPSGYNVTIGGESDEVLEMVEQMLLMIGLALIFIYLVMVAQFQSLLSPFIVLFTIPLAFTGGLIALLIADEQLSMLSLMGFLVLMGTVVNNGIVFVDYTNQLRKGGMERRDALIATGKTRMRPIFMTALTTILAMVQLMTGDDMSSQMAGGMALVITGGLIYATFMTLYIIPIMYDIFFKSQPLDVDIGSENLDDVLDDAAAFIAEKQVKEPAPELEQA